MSLVRAMKRKGQKTASGKRSCWRLVERRSLAVKGTFCREVKKKLKFFILVKIIILKSNITFYKIVVLATLMLSTNVRS